MKKEVIAVAMSGGVDSSVTALLLKQQGYDVIGFTMLLSNEPSISPGHDEQRCCGIQNADDAKRVASIIDIPHYVINLKNEFRKHVLQPFIQSYLSGLTPSPCILCNYYLKFQVLLNKALALGANKLATGHYACLEYDASLKRWLLKKAQYITKDQSYFLFSLHQNQLEKALFPLGIYKKSQVRILAAQHSLPIASKPESQQLCFISDNDYRNLIKTEINDLPPHGNFISSDGKMLGTHKGIHNYTIGQRRQLGVAIGKPLYVIKIIPESNTIILGEENELYASFLTAHQLNWIAIEPPRSSFKASARIRYKHEEAPATVTPSSDSEATITFDEPQRAITPGQAVVLYDNDVVLGGGWIM